VNFTKFRRAPGADILLFPLPWQGRLALVDADLHAAPPVRTFATADLNAIEAFAPDSIALSLPLALHYAGERLAGAPLLLSLRCAMVVLSSLDSSGEPMTDGHRDLLWRAFGLPVFEQLRGAGGRILARECEVHDGLHAAGLSMHPDSGETLIAGQTTGCSGEIVTVPCDCGLTTPRIRNLIRLRRRAAAACAA
jgi:hypothetical protein